MIDTAGNVGEWTESKVIERDTVSPLEPVVEVSKSGDIWAEYLGLNLSKAEADSTATIEVFLNPDKDSSDIGTIVKTLTAVIPEDANYTNTNLIGKLLCGGGKYSVRVKLTDRALNDSEYSEFQSITTKDCPRCGYSGGEFAIPIRNDLQNRPVQWVVTQDFDSHGGSIDLATLGVENFGHGIPVYPIAPGKVVVAKYQGGIPQIYGKDNHVLIDHGNGLKAWYVHFMNETNQGLSSLPKVGDYVTTDTVIGHLGNTGLYYTSYTGQYAGTHLHLNVTLNGKDIDPSQNWGTSPNVDCYVDTLGDDPYNGEHAENLGSIELEFIKKGNRIEFTKSNIPAPKLTAVTTENNQDYTIYGVAIKKNHPTIAKIYEEKCVLWAFNCKTELRETKNINIHHAEVKAYKETWTGHWGIHQQWNDDELGGFSFTKNIPKDLHDNEHIYARSYIYGEFDCLGLKCKYGDYIFNNLNESGKSNRVLPRQGLGKGKGIEKNFGVYAYDDSRIASFKLFSSPDNQKYISKYDQQEAPEVWIVSHGMNNQYTHMEKLAEAIKTQNPNDIVLLLDWSGARDGVKTPNDTDQWIRPTAQEAVKKLKEWGFNSPPKLKMAGHSMGTLMINEIAKEYANIGNTKALYFLDPPNFLLGTNNFKVDDRKEQTNTLYTETNGYTQHYPNASISRAFTGIKKNGDGNWCGNARLNRTAKESISVYFNDFKEIWAPPANNCGIHGYVHQTFARLISDQKLVFDGQEKLNLDAGGLAQYGRTQFYDDDYNFHASLNVKGQDDIQTIMTKTPNQNNQLNLWGRSGGALYSNFNAPAHSLVNQTTLNIKTFGNNDNNFDRISLEYNAGSALKDGDYIHNYRIAITNNKPTIYRETNQYKTSFGTAPTTVTIAAEFPEFVVEGVRMGEDFAARLEDKLNSPNSDNPIFVLR
jgi:murein DD-endopeptidase MepM/ murein hydrolase activator NlpD